MSADRARLRTTRRATIMIPTSFEGEHGIEEHMIAVEVDTSLISPPRMQSKVVVKKTCKEKCTRFLKITLPHVALVALLTAYTIVGAAIFHTTELPHEIKMERIRMEEIVFTKRYFINYMWNLSQADGVTPFYWARSADQELQKLVKALYMAYEEEYVTLSDILNDTHRTVWTFPQAIFFATTVITTIGYGNLVPRTISGRIWCIVFSVFGIPLMLITIADIGKFFSDLITFLYRQYRLCKAQLRKHSRNLRFLQWKRKLSSVKDADKSLVEKSTKSDEVHLPAVMAIVVIVAYTAIGGALFQIWEGWEYFEAFYFCFVTMVTIGFGDMVPSEEVYMLFTIIYIIIGLSITTMCIDLAGSEYITKLHYFGQKIGTAKDVVGEAVASGLHAGENLLKYTGFVRTAGGKFVPITDTYLLTDVERAAVRKKYGLSSQADLGDFLLEDLLAEAPNRSSTSGEPGRNNILFLPLSDKVRKVLKPNIGVLPQEISEEDAYVVENKAFNLPTDRICVSNKKRRKSGRVRYMPRTSSWPKKEEEAPLLIAPFILKESDL